MVSKSTERSIMKQNKKPESKKYGNCKNNCSENIHSINNQKFRFPSIIQRLKEWMMKV